MMPFFDNVNQEVEYIAAWCVGIVAYIITGLMIHKNWTKHSRVLSILIVTMAMWGASPIFDPVFFTIAKNMATFQEYFAVITLSSSVSFGFNALGNVLLVAFMVNVFFGSRYHWEAILLMTLEVLVFPLSVGFILIGFDPFPIYALHLACAVIIYMTLYWAAGRGRKRASKLESENVAGIKGLQYIGLSGIFMLAALVSFVIQEVASTVGIYDTIFIPLGWIIAGFASVCLYVGYVLPGWLQKRWESDHK